MCWFGVPGDATHLVLVEQAKKPVNYEERIRTAKTEAQKTTYRKMQTKQAARLEAEAALVSFMAKPKR